MRSSGKRVMVGPLLPISPLGDGEMTNRSVCYFDVLGVDNKPTVWGALRIRVHAPKGVEVQQVVPPHDDVVVIV